MTEPAPYDQIVFSGGGLRCFWHGGWMKVAEQSLDFKPKRVTGSSGGALSAAAWLGGRAEALMDIFRGAVDDEAHNVTIRDLDESDGWTPHQRLYARVVDSTLTEAAQARIAEGPAFQISVATPGDDAFATIRALLGGTIYEVEQTVSAHPEPAGGNLVGFAQRLIDAREAAGDGTLVRLVRLAATIPPAFAPETWDGEPLFDGGMVDKAPLPEPDEGRTLILLTKRFDRLPDDEGGRLEFVQPSEAVLDGSKLDFTDPDLLTQAWSQGELDARAWLGAH